MYAEVRASETVASELAGARGLIISGGPSSVFDSTSPTVDPGIFKTGQAVLGICYGQQLMAHLLGGTVAKGEKGEYGSALVEMLAAGDPMFNGLHGTQPVWMNHRDQVSVVPEGFSVAGKTDTCAIAAIAAPERGFYGVQFHPEVVHTARGREFLSNFVFGVCHCEKDWDPSSRAAGLEAEIRATVGDRNVFFFVSGGVDSTVAFTLCTRALGAERVRGVYVDTGLMREGETEFVSKMPQRHSGACEPISFWARSTGVTEPEKKRHIIGEEFVAVQERIIEGAAFAREPTGFWDRARFIPTPSNRAARKHASVIKTHHNRVAGIQKLIESGRIVEPLHTFYKDEVREVGRELELPSELLDRHPFPGPGLAIRCLCSDVDAPVRAIEDGFVIPVSSVGVLGDARSYAPVLAIDAHDHARATELTNRMTGMNRVVAIVETRAPISELEVRASAITARRIELLRRADAIVRRLSHESKFDDRIWQFPVILIPLGTADAPESVVLRPVDSVDGMTAQSVLMPAELLSQMTRELMALPGIAGVFYDLTHKPPGTIEWE